MKNDEAPAPPPTEISTIRDILMGQHIAEYDQRHAQVQDEFAATKAHFTGEIARLSSQTDQRFQQLEKDMNERFDRLEKILTDHVARLDKKLHEMSKTDKANLGKMLEGLSKQLINNG